ncbi:hypothetical protein BG000_009078 [Podila horticola]|nr:hypothetical protein BG000_009078 [Podila horticola]
MSDTKPKTSSSPDAPVVKKIPRPPNSFLIYRKEHAKKFAGLVATELSTKLAMAWKKETPERQAYYAGLAERAKQEHALKFPNYKFTPVKRGTGKRALQLAARANASRTASGASSIPNKAPTPRKKANSLRSSSSMPEMSNPILASTRSGRQVSKPQRYTPSVAYPSRTNIYSRSNIPRAYPSSLFFSPSPYENYPLEAPMAPPSSSSPSPTFSDQTNHHYNLESGSDLSDPEDGDNDDYPGSDCYTDRVLLHMSQQHGVASPTRSWAFDNTSPMANQAVFEPLVMEAFEPECLAHHHDPSSSSSSSLWTTPEGSPTATMMRQLYEQYQQHVFPPHHHPYHHQHYQNPVHQHVQHLYNNPSPLYSFNHDNTRYAPLEEAVTVLPSQPEGPTDPAIQFSMEMDKLQRDLTLLLPSPVSAPHHSSMVAAMPSSLEAPSCSAEGAYPFVPAMLVQEDIMMSPALSTCSSVSSGEAQDVQSYFARALELL